MTHQETKLERSPSQERDDLHAALRLATEALKHMESCHQGHCFHQHLATNALAAIARGKELTG